MALALLLLAAPAAAQEPPPPTSAPTSPTTPPATPPADSEGTPFRIADQLPPWLRLSTEHQLRYAYLWNHFRPGQGGNGPALSLRTAIQLELDLGFVTLGAEGLDARGFFFDEDVTPPTTGVVNTFELLQAYLTVDLAEALELGRDVELKLSGGRLTRDYGSRRNLARNVFRNTINAFTGVELELELGGHRLQALFSFPVRRRPFDTQSLLNNDSEFDEESDDLVLWSLYYTSAPVGGPLALIVEGYLFGLHERDDGDGDELDERLTRDRQLYTPGIRLWRGPRRARVDFELELQLQVGRGRATSSASDTEDLDHLAGYLHAELGYTADDELEPRLGIELDYASGDESPTDGQINRYDVLFGPPVFDLGPSGVWTAFNRRNLVGAGPRFEIGPPGQWRFMLHYRPIWLAAKRDAWVDAGLRDPLGRSGSFVGHFLEGRLRYELVPGNVRLETGFAFLGRGEFARDVPSAPPGGEPVYLYAQLNMRF